MRIGLAVLPILFVLPVSASELRITVQGIRSPHGTILIGLYDSLESFSRAIELSDKDGFLNDPNRFAAVALRANTAMKSEVVLTNLDPGPYAIIVNQRRRHLFARRHARRSVVIGRGRICPWLGTLAWSDQAATAL